MEASKYLVHEHKPVVFITKKIYFGFFYFRMNIYRPFLSSKTALLEKTMSSLNECGPRSNKYTQYTDSNTRG